MNKGLIGFLFLLSTPIFAEGMSFSHKDWEIACDNTRTCRAAGYQADHQTLSVSVLFTRTAGAQQPVRGQVMLGDIGIQERSVNLPAQFGLQLRIDGKIQGKVTMKLNSLVADLPDHMLPLLLTALAKRSRIEWVWKEQSWFLSSEGSTAVFLKMDEFQGRLNTPSALVRKGKKPESSVLPALPVPVLTVPTIPPTTPADAALVKDANLQQAVAQARKNIEDCNDRDDLDRTLTVHRLTSKHLLVSTACWLAAYNYGHAYWVVNDQPPYNPVLVTTRGNDYSDGTINANHKGRGIGDCWSSESWSWNGKTFIGSAAATTGMCKLMAAGGSWSLPTLVMELRQN